MPNTPASSALGSYYIDDVRVTTAIERTTASPLPAALQGDGTHPLVYLNANGLARMESDGSGVQQLYSGLAGQPLNPIWSSAGDRIAVLDESLKPDNNTNININPAFISIVSTMDANGGHVQEIYRTDGLPGERATPSTTEKPALDVLIYSVDWSPDDATLALTLCSDNRYFNGSTTDHICWVELIAVATGDSLLTFNSAYRANWSSDNRILFEDTDAYQSRADGIWEVDMNQDPITATLMVTGTGSQSNPSLRTDNWAVWSADGTRFATVRDVAGHYTPDGERVYHEAIMVFDRATLVGRAVLLVDHGSQPTGLNWSLDGQYLLYNLSQGNATDIWWLEVATGKTGQVTSNGAGINANWRPDCTGDSCDGPVGTETLHIRRYDVRVTSRSI